MRPSLLRSVSVIMPPSLCTKSTRTSCNINAPVHFVVRSNKRQTQQRQQGLLGQEGLQLLQGLLVEMEWLQGEMEQEGQQGQQGQEGLQWLKGEVEAVLLQLQQLQHLPQQLLHPPLQQTPGN
jgi:hypothetical protein